jgi:Ni,Fe-hydrogenase I large subunit
MVRQLARMHEGPKYFQWTRQVARPARPARQLLHQAVEHASGKGFGSTEAARGSLSDWIVIENGRIENYQVVTPTAWNIGPRDGEGVLGPIEQALVGFTGRRHLRPGRARPRRPQLRLLPRVHRARLRRQDRQAALEVRHQRDGLRRRVA